MIGIRRWLIFLIRTAVIASLFLTAVGCGKKAETARRTELVLATTTSTQDSGLLDEWVPMFEAEYPYAVKVVAVGSGQAMEMGRNGEADVLLVHSPAAEEKMVAEGYAVRREAVMHNRFLLVGPPSDPAGVKDAASAADAFARLAKSQSGFISRGDDSGTHVKEREVWKAAGVNPSGAWYMESGKGMADTLRIASEQGAYTLTDNATYLFLKHTLDLDMLFQGDEILNNNYHVMIINPEKYPDLNHDGARAFEDFMLSRKAQEFLNVYGVEEYGQQLFYPDAL
jgi:tungstate transport system substrate-binding protein